MSNFYTVLKFIHNTKVPNSKYPMVSRTIGKIVVPTETLSIEKHNNTFWVCEIIEETGFGNKGIITAKPLYIVDPIPLLPGMFNLEKTEHWAFLTLKEGTPIKPYYIPQLIKKPFLQSGETSVVCIPYTGLHLKELYQSI